MKLPPHVRWPMFIAGALVLQVLASLVIIYVATSNPSYAVEDDYYQKALQWDAKRDQDHRNAELGWQLAHAVAPPGPTGEQAILTATLGDALGSPIDGALVTLEAFHNARADQILSARLEPVGEGQYRTSLPMHRSGLWELRFVAERGEDRFTHTEIRHLILDRRSRN